MSHSMTASEIWIESWSLVRTFSSTHVLRALPRILQNRMSGRPLSAWIHTQQGLRDISASCLPSGQHPGLSYHPGLSFIIRAFLIYPTLRFVDFWPARISKRLKVTISLFVICLNLQHRHLSGKICMHFNFRLQEPRCFVLLFYRNWRIAASV